jgi:hypothetical protein
LLQKVSYNFFFLFLLRSEIKSYYTLEDKGQMVDTVRRETVGGQILESKSEAFFATY